MTEDLTDVTFFILSHRMSFSANEEKEVLRVLDSLCAVRQYLITQQQA